MDHKTNRCVLKTMAIAIFPSCSGGFLAQQETQDGKKDSYSNKKESL